MKDKSDNMILQSSLFRWGHNRLSIPFTSIHCMRIQESINTSTCIEGSFLLSTSWSLQQSKTYHFVHIHYIIHFACFKPNATADLLPQRWPCCTNTSEMNPIEYNKTVKDEMSAQGPFETFLISKHFLTLQSITWKCIVLFLNDIHSNKWINNKHSKDALRLVVGRYRR